MTRLADGSYLTMSPHEFLGWIGFVAVISVAAGICLAMGVTEVAAHRRDRAARRAAAKLRHPAGRGVVAAESRLQRIPDEQVDALVADATADFALWRSDLVGGSPVRIRWGFFAVRNKQARR